MQLLPTLNALLTVGLLWQDRPVCQSINLRMDPLIRDVEKQTTVILTLNYGRRFD